MRVSSVLIRAFRESGGSDQPDRATDAAKKAFLKAKSVPRNPKSRMRNDGTPCGLKVRWVLNVPALSELLVQNLGATCYVNAAVQVC